MRGPEFLQRCWRRFVLLPPPTHLLRLFYLRSLGARIGRGTRVPPLSVTWPHQISIGEDCVIQPGVFFNYSHFWTPGPSICIHNRVFLGRNVEFNIQGGIEIGDDSLIASGCVFVDHDHGRAGVGPMNRQESEIRPISIAHDVWIGANAVVLKGVSVGERAVIAAGAVVTKQVPAGETWAGVPARRIPGGKDGPGES